MVIVQLWFLFGVTEEVVLVQESRDLAESMSWDRPLHLSLSLGNFVP